MLNHIKNTFQSNLCPVLNFLIGARTVIGTGMTVAHQNELGSRSKMGIFRHLTGFFSAATYKAGLDAHAAGNYATALTKWQQAAKQGNASAQNALGFLYAKGEGVPQDDSEAIKWYRMAAAQGSASGQFNLAYSYAKGREGTPDQVTAHMWANIAAGNGHKDGARLRDKLAEKMSRESLSESQERARVCKASNYTNCD